MKKLIIAGIYIATITLSNLSFAMSSATEVNDMLRDARSALEVSRYEVYKDLQKNMQASFYSLPMPEAEDFGIDDIRSYTSKEKLVLGLIDIEG